MHAHPAGRSLTRRAVLKRLALAALGASLLPSQTVAAPLDLALLAASHPILGHWLAVTPLGPAHMRFDADGSVLVAWPHSVDGPNGYVEYTTSATGAWQPVSVHGFALLVLAVDTDAIGNIIGEATLASRPVVSLDGRTFASDTATDRLTRTSRDGTVIPWRDEAGAPIPLSGIRMWPEEPQPG